MENEPRRGGGDARTAPVEALGKSDLFLDFQERLARCARVDRPVLLVGERGTGKELAAARVHFLSRRWGGPFIKLNCAALSPTVLESELFGHEQGAFTGAARRRIGRFEAASGGTLFLDEIGQMPMSVQEKILRVVEYGSFERVGASESVHVDVRLVGATNANLPAMVAAGEFKADLLDRLSFEVMIVPPLRARGAGDIDLFVQHFASRMAVELGWKSVPEIGTRATSLLRAYPWPGNVRELKNVVERAVCRAEDGRVVDDVIFDPFGTGGVTALAPPEPGSPGARVAATEPAAAASTECELPVNLPEVLAATERRLLQQALAKARFRQREAANLLGLSYDQFRGLYRRYQERSGNGEGAPDETARMAEVSPKST
jgi:psp operon transcriptional activator